jgi:hypothetical protein
VAEPKLVRRIATLTNNLLVDNGIMNCLEAATGETVWTERVGGKYAASPIYADGRIYLFDQQGTTSVLKPGRALEVHRRHRPGEAGP